LNTRLFFLAAVTSLAWLGFDSATRINAADQSAASDQINQILMSENGALGIELKPMPIANDATFLRRVYVWI
jgi:hypothetical protein